MAGIVLDDVQAHVVANASEPVAVRDRSGRLLGFISPAWTAEEIAEAERILAADEPGFTYDQVKEQLRNLSQK
jgi:hypothetical protein